MFINYYLRHIQQLVDGVKEYVDLRQRSLRLSVVEKLTILLSSAVVAVLLLVLGLVAFFFLSIAVSVMAMFRLRPPHCCAWPCSRSPPP
jgi:hypothetical protein